MLRVILGSVVVILFGCAGSAPEVVRTAPAGVDAMACAKGTLLERGYELRELNRDVLEAEVRRVYSAPGGTRELIEVSLSGEGTEMAELRVSIQALRYGSADHGLPVNRQSVLRVRPSEELVEVGDEVVESCRRVTRA